MFKHVPTCSQRMQGVQTHFLSDSGISWLYGAMMLILSTYIYIYFYIFLYVAMVVYTLHGACWLQALHPSRMVPWVRAA